MAKVKIVYVPDKELRGPDLDRIGKVEDIPDELARVMVAGGEAVWDDSHEDQPPAKTEPAKVEATTADPAAAPIKATPAPKQDTQ